jgi:alpha-glucuronidase
VTLNPNVEMIVGSLLPRAAAIFVAFVACAWASAASSEDGYDLWLRYRPVSAAAQAAYVDNALTVVPGAETPTLAVARAELERGLNGLIGRPIGTAARPLDGAVIIGTPKSSPIIAGLRLPLKKLGREGFLIRSVTADGKKMTVIAANQDVGVLYGVFAFLRRIQTSQPINDLDISETPTSPLRMLNHWDNLDRTVERGYAGASLWDWHKLPQWRDPRYTDYARANASIGINATVLTNVNANAQVLTPQYLEKVAALADMFRPWGIRVFLTARFSAPMEIGGLKTADPADPLVRAWWRGKSDEIYRLVPDFGGFLVKANSEGQPGPQDYKRTHADGANMLADALQPHGGTVIWRVFVYTARPGQDRAKQAYEEFRPLDGKFRSNVMLQVKNGPIDFQPREPFHPLFGAMRKTPILLEAQITKEYLGFATHLAYLGPLWEEVLDANTCRPHCGRPVARTVSGMAGVSNIGTDRNWTGSHFDQANWYAFGRLAWNNRLSAREIAEEWARMTWGKRPDVAEPVVGMMMQSREAVVNYMTPLGLHHLMATGHHFGPGPWVNDLPRDDWNPTYFHRADANGIGFDRTKSGSNAVAQYAPRVAACFSARRCVPDEYLLWFHQVGWDERMRSGRTLWNELLAHYDQGVSQARDMRATWRSLQDRVDSERFAQVDAFLGIQEREATWWRDASITYFQSVSGRPLPPDVRPPEYSLDHYKSLRFMNVPGDPE